MSSKSHEDDQLLAAIQRLIEQLSGLAEEVHVHGLMVAQKLYETQRVGV
jgi:hypothetical protein